LPWVATGEGIDEPPAKWLARAAALLQDALLAAAEIDAAAKLSPVLENPLPPPSYGDMDAGESSDEEGGSSEGIRLRVRVSRGESEKWGITWHANIFKMSQRLVVKEIAEGSVLAKWNEDKPERIQVSYGDRLIRINGRSFSEAKAAESADKMRGELKKPSIRALFWRPGCGREDDDSGKESVVPDTSRCPPSSILIFGAGAYGGTSAAAVVAAHSLLHGDGANLEDSLNTLGDAVSLLRNTDGTRCHDLMTALQEFATQSRALPDYPQKADSEVVEVESPAAVSPPQVEAEIPPDEANVRLGADCDKDTNGAMERPLETTVAAETQVSASNTGDNVPSWTYSCRKCGTALFHDLSILPHFTEGAQKSSRRWASTGGAENPTAAHTCTSVFVEPMKWMGELTEETGKLTCGNPRCKQKLGGYSWHGLPCSRGQWQSPAFQIHCARVESMPAARRARGGPPQRVFVE
jgi:hypothetical protein